MVPISTDPGPWLHLFLVGSLLEEVVHLSSWHHAPTQATPAPISRDEPPNCQQLRWTSLMGPLRQRACLLHPLVDLNWGRHASTELIDEGSYSFHKTSNYCKKQGLQPLTVPVAINALFLENILYLVWYLWFFCYCNKEINLIFYFNFLFQNYGGTSEYKEIP